MQRKFYAITKTSKLLYLLMLSFLLLEKTREWSSFVLKLSTQEEYFLDVVNINIGFLEFDKRKIMKERNARIPGEKNGEDIKWKRKMEGASISITARMQSK